MAEESRTPADRARAVYEEAESRTAAAAEQLVRSQGFGELLARITENAVALNRIAQSTLDMWVRNLRVAGREDVTGLARQLARTEDKLEMVLQQVESLEAKLDAQTNELGGLFEHSGASTAAKRQGGGSSSRRSTSNGRSTSRRGTRSK